MLSCFRHRCVATYFGIRTNPMPQQLRRLSDDQKIRTLENKNLNLWSKHIGELVRKRQMLSLIGEYIELQEQYVASRLHSTKKMLEIAKLTSNLKSQSVIVSQKKIPK